MSWLIWLLVLVVIFPVLTLLHEFGHAVPARAFGAENVTILLGPREPSNPVFHQMIGGIAIVGSSWLTLFFGHMRFSGGDRLSIRQRVIVSLGGPAVSLALAVILVPLAYATHSGPEWLRIIIQGAAANAFITLLVTAIPMTYPRWWPGYAGRPSDMLRVVRILRTEDTHG